MSATLLTLSPGNPPIDAPQLGQDVINRLTAQQVRVLDLLTDGLSNIEIAGAMGISPRTVEIHRSHALRVIGARNSTHGAVIWDRWRHPAPSITAPSITATAFQRPNGYTANGKQILRDGDHFADAATPDIARALTLTLNDAQLLFFETPLPDQEFVERTLWP